MPSADGPLILNHIAKVVDCEHKTAPTQEKGYPSIRTPNIGRGRLILDGVNFVSEETYNQWTRRAVPKEGDLILAREAPAGNVAIIPRNLKLCLGQRTVLIRPEHSKVDSHYLTYLLLGNEIQARFQSYSTGATVGHLNVRDIRNLTLPDLPPFITQRKIAAVLSAYDDLIENNTRRVAVLEEMARLLYREWFVHFRFPGHEQVKLVDSPLGKIPEGWKVVKVGEISQIHRGRSYSKKNLLESGGIPFVNLKNIEREGGFRRDGLKCYEGLYKEAQTVKNTEIVIAVTDMTQERRIIGRAARIPDLGAPFGVFSMDLVKIEPRNEVSNEFLYGMFQYSSFSETVKEFANGVNVLHLTPDRISESILPLPTKNLTSIYSTITNEIYSLCDDLEKKNANLQSTRDLLLPKLISGEVDISDLKITVPEIETAA